MGSENQNFDPEKKLPSNLKKIYFSKNLNERTMNVYGKWMSRMDQNFFWSRFKGHFATCSELFLFCSFLGAILDLGGTQKWIQDLCSTGKNECVFEGNIPRHNVEIQNNNNGLTLSGLSSL